MILELEKLDWDGDVTAGLPVTGKINGMDVTVEANGDVTVTEGTLSDEEDDKPKTLATLKTSEEPVEGNTTLEDTNGDSITIPDGFNIDKDSPIVVEEGIVIEDSEENQYVWIPVFEKNEERTWGADYATAGVVTAKTAERTSFTTADYTAIQTALKTYTNTYKKTNFSDVWYGDENYGQYGYYNGEDFIYYTNGDMSENEYNTLYQNMLVSVYKNGGFYIGRYEMGTGVATSLESAESLTREAMTEYTASTATGGTTVEEKGAPSIQGMPTPVSKANAVGYTWITQSQAQMLAEKMGEEYGYGNTTSSLMFGVQWDAVCVFLEKCGTLSDGTEFDSSYLIGHDKGKLWGNYKNSTYTMDRGFYNIYTSTSPYILKENWNEKTSKTASGSWLCTTGASDQNSALNIYDFGGNLYEFTLERYSNSFTPVTDRGGYFGVSYSASFRTEPYTYYSSSYHSARPTLWL